MEKENISLRQGYMVVLGANKKWKARWFVLSEDQISCHPKKNKSVVLRAVPLRGCAVICPCNDVPDVNPQGLIKLCTPEGEELLFLAAGEQDRDGWAHALGAVLRSLSTSKQVSNHKMPFQTFRAYANVSEIIGAIQDPDAGVATATHVRGGEVYKNCFKGSDVIDWLLRWSIVRNRENGSAMAQTLLKLGHLQEVDLNDGSLGLASKFNDGERLYRFTSINLGVKRNSFYDSTDSDSSSSDDDEDVEEKDAPKVKKGKILRESFLLKKRTMRKGWRVVKVCAQDNPPALHYFRAALSVGPEENIPVKTVVLENSTVTETVKPAPSKAAANPKSAKYRLCIRDKKGRCLTLQTKDEQEKCEWLTLLQRLTQPPASEAK